MGTLFRKTLRRPIPQSAALVEKNGQRFARWRSRGKVVTAPVEEADGEQKVVVEIGTFYARFRDHTGQTVERSTGCRDETNARQKLAKWEREAEQINAGVIDAAVLEIARAAAGPLDNHIDAYEQALTAANVSAVYKANALRAVRRLKDELGFTSVREIRRDKLEQWLADAVSKGMGARTRNYYRDAIVRFANWLRDAGRLTSHDLNKLPKADERADPKRHRRALTPEEIARLLEVAARRPLEENQTVRRGKNKGQRSAELRPEVAERLLETGRERVLIYRTLICTGLRFGELRTLTVARLDLTPRAECIRLEAKNEKNRTGSTIPLRSDLAADLRAWIGEKNLNATATVFSVPAGLRRIFDRDMKAAGIPKRDERGRTIDVHAMRTTFGTLLSTSGTAPRTAQAAMRHSDIKLTMGVYTDPKLLDVRQAVENLPSITPQSTEVLKSVTSPAGPTHPECSHDCSETGGSEGDFLPPADTVVTASEHSGDGKKKRKNPGNVRKKAPVTTPVITGAVSGRRDLNPRPLAPQASALAKLRYGPMFRHVLCNCSSHERQPTILRQSIGSISDAVVRPSSWVGPRNSQSEPLQQFFPTVSLNPQLQTKSTQNRSDSSPHNPPVGETDDTASHHYPDALPRRWVRALDPSYRFCPKTSSSQAR